MSNEAMRFNQGKPDFTLVDFKSLEPMVRVLEFGANKYARHNWRKGLSKENILGSLQRHVGKLIDKVNKGEDEVDEETLIHEIGHIMCNCMFYSALHVQSEEKQKIMSRIDNFDWEAAERAEKQGHNKETPVDWEDRFFIEYNRFPRNQAELNLFITEWTDEENEEEEDDPDYNDRDYDYEEEECPEDSEGVEGDELDFSDEDDPIQALIERGDQMERAARPKVNPARIIPKEKPVIVLQKSEKNDSFVNDFVTNGSRVRGLGFRTQDLI